jgi:autotransporter passenger strand-loop-strand repeat protein
MTTTLSASTTAQLNQDIATVDAATSGGFIIDLQGNITETANLDAINLQSGVQLTIDGSGSFTLDGAGSFGFVVDAGAGSATIENLDISNAVLAGGSVPGTVTLSNDVFSGTVAIAKNLTIDEVAPVTLGDTHGPATVINEAGSTYNVDVTGDVINEGLHGVSRFVNKGTLAQTGLAAGVSNINVDVTDTGTLSVAGGSNLRFFGANNSFSGTYVGGGMIDYWDGSTDVLGTIDMTNGACTTVDGATVNQSGVVTLSTSTTIKVATGTWNFTSDNGLVAVDPSSSGASFTLNGTLAKTGGTGTTVIGCDFNGDGAATISVASGTLAFNGLSNNFSDAISGAGTFSIGGGGTDAIDAGTTIKTSGWTITHAGTDVTLNAGLSYSGTFREQSGATLTLTPSNNLTLTNSASFTDATIDGSGILTLAGGKATMNGGTIGAGVTIELLSGTLSASGIVANSGTLFASGGTVSIAGTANGITVGVSGKEIVQSGGTASNTTVSSGGSEIVLSGGTAIGTTILAGGTVTVSSGGTFEFTSGTTGMPIVHSGATLEVGSGYVFSGIINSGVRLEILSGGTDIGATVSSGGREIVFAGGAASNTTVLKGGVEAVSSGGVVSGTTVNNGGSEIIGAHGTDDGAQISGGRQLVHGVASGATVFSGSQVVEAGGTASETTVSGAGTEIVLSGGTAVGATSLAGGTVTVSSGGTFEFTSGTTAKPIVHAGATLEIGSGYVFSGTINSGVRLEILSGGADSGATVSSGGREIVSAHGTDDGAQISGGKQLVFGVASGATIFTGSQIVEAGGTASNTTVLKGGVETVSSGGSASGTMVSSGGTVNVLSGDTSFENATVFGGGKLNISKGGTAVDLTVSSGGELNVAGTTANVTVSSGGHELVSSGGIASDTTIAGGTLEITGGGSVGGTVTFAANSGTLQLDHSTTFSGTVAGMAAQDKLDLRDIKFATEHLSASITNISTTLTVTDGTHIAHILLLGHYIGSTFTASNDGIGGTSIVDPPATSASVASLAQTHKG